LMRNIARTLSLVIPAEAGIHRAPKLEQEASNDRIHTARDAPAA
jgi:hypothetical protein